MPTFTSDKCRALYEHWLSLPRLEGAVVPRKSAFDPTAIPKLLPRVLLHDLRQPGRAILRLVGTGLVEQYGFDPTGDDYSKYVAPERWPEAYGELIKVASHPCGMRVLTEHTHAGGAIHEDEAVGLPLEADDGSGQFLLFVDDVLLRPKFNDSRRKPFVGIRVKDRTYIDVGRGLPPSGLHDPIQKPLARDDLQRMQCSAGR